MEMEWWSRKTYPLRSFCGGVAFRLGFRKRGLPKLGRDVKACEYEDVHVMWEMLRRNESELDGFPDKRKKRRRSVWNIFGWARSPCICCRF